VSRGYVLFTVTGSTRRNCVFEEIIIIPFQKMAVMRKERCEYMDVQSR
jgi:hypothetical protein